jgi:hypothetical protein
MREARVAILGRAMLAEEYEALAPERRRDYAESLTCTGCGQRAYFIRRARNGRAACFGRPPAPRRLRTGVSGFRHRRATGDSGRRVRTQTRQISRTPTG